MKNLDHPNIIKVFDYYKTECNILCIILEFAEEGDLHKKVLN